MGRPPITAEERKERARQRTRDWKLTHPHHVKMQKKRYKEKRKSAPKPPAPPSKDPTGELEYSSLDGIDTPYAESGTDNGSEPDRSDEVPPPGTSAPLPPGIDDPLECVGPRQELGRPEVAPLAGIQEPAEFLEDLAMEHKRAMLAHIRKELEESYDRDKERLRQSFGTGKV